MSIDFGLRVDFHAYPCRRLIDQIDGLIRQKAVSDIAVRQLRGGHDRRVGDVHAMVHFVFFLQAAQYRDGGFNRRLINQHLLEAPLQRRILLDVLAVLIQRGRPHAVQFATGERGLEHIAGVDRAFRLARAHHGVKLVDKHDNAAFGLRNLLQDRFQAFLELAAVLGSRQQRGHVQGKHLLVLQGLRHLAIDDTLRQAFHDGGLADARLADQDRIILGAPLQHLDRAPDLVIAPDDGVELAHARPLGQVESIFLQCFAAALGFGAADILAAADGADRLLHRCAVGAVLPQQIAGFAFIL